MTMLMREAFYEPAWMAPTREPLTYMVEAPFVGFGDVHKFPVPQEHFFSSAYGAPLPYSDPMARISRSSSAFPAFGHYSEESFVDLRPGPLRSSSAIPAYPYPKVPYHDSPLSHGPARSASSMPSFREQRESHTKHHKVGPEIELSVHMCCSKCETKVKDILRKVSGVTEVITDRRKSKVTVCGKVDPQVVLERVQKAKKKFKADFYTKQIYSDAFINFIQSKTSRAEPEEEPELISSYHQHVPSENGDSHHAYDENENLSSYEEYPGYSEIHEDDSHEETEIGSFDEDDVVESQRGYYNQQYYGQRSDISPYGMPSSSFARVEESYRSVDGRPHYESPYYSHVDPSYGAREPMPYYERESTSTYGDYGSSYGEPSSYRPSQGYGPSGISNPGYMKRVISDY